MKPGTSLETKMTKLRLSYFGHNKRRQSSLEKIIMLVKKKKRAEKKTKYEMR